MRSWRITRRSADNHRSGTSCLPVRSRVRQAGEPLKGARRARHRRRRVKTHGAPGSCFHHISAVASVVDVRTSLYYSGKRCHNNAAEPTCNTPPSFFKRGWTPHVRGGGLETGPLRTFWVKNKRGQKHYKKGLKVRVVRLQKSSRYSSVAN